MIQIEALPALDWNEQALFEMEQFGSSLVKQSTAMYQFDLAGVIGLVHSSLTSPPWLWAAFASEMDFAALRKFAELQNHIPSGTRTCIQAGYMAGERFAEFFGFVQTEDCFTMSGITYNVFRRD